MRHYNFNQIKNLEPVKVLQIISDGNVDEMIKDLEKERDEAYQEYGYAMLYRWVEEYTDQDLAYFKEKALVLSATVKQLRALKNQME